MSDISRRTFFAATAGVGAAAFLPMPSAQAAGTTIATTYQQQQQPNWCSPAATRIALSAAGVLPTQAALADGLGVVGSSGLQDPYAIARVLNNRLGLNDSVFKYVLKQDMDQFDEVVNYAVSIDKPVVYNVLKVGGQTYTGSGHYITITGRRPVSGGVEYRISDPDSPARTGNWYSRADVKSWNKFGRYTAYGYPG